MPGCINYKEWKVYPLENKWIKLRIAPQLGGRIIQLEMNGYEFFFVNPLLAGKEPDSTRLGENGAWLNFGGEKIWPAPQGWDSPDQWPGPPDPVLDSGEYNIEFKNEKENALRLTSPLDHYTGLQIQKDVFLSESRSEVKILATFKNASDILRSWSVWPVLQMNSSGKNAGRYQIVCPINPKSRFSNGYKVMHGLVNNPQFKTDDSGNFIANYQYLVGKVGLDVVSGWAAYVDKESGKVFVITLLQQAGETYPDDTSVQIWTSGQGMVYSRNTMRQHNDDKILNPPYMEMELFSPLQEIQPGEEIQFEYRMLASTIPPNETIKSVNEFGVIANTFTLKPKKDGVSLSSKYGVFTEGILKINRRISSEDNRPVCLYETTVNPLYGINVELFVEKKWSPDTEMFITSEIFDRNNHFLGEIEKIRIVR